MLRGFDKFEGTLPQLITALFASMGAISDGMQFGWTAPFIKVLQSDRTPIEISESDVSWLESTYMIGGLMGLPITIYLVDKIGRQKTILFASLLNFAAWLLIGLANRVGFLYAARFLTGLAADVGFVAAPMYMAEIADQKIRGFLAGGVYLMSLGGILIVYSVAPYTPIYVSSIIGCVINGTQLVGLPFMPDSPYFCLSKGDQEKAEKCLRKLRSAENVDRELGAIKLAIDRQQAETGRPQDLFISRSNRKAVIIMTVLNVAQHFSGITVILMNLHSILNAAGSEFVSSNTAGIIFSGVLFASGFVTNFVVDSFGRRVLLAFSSLLSALSLLAVAVFFTAKEAGTLRCDVSWIPMISLMFYAVVFKNGLGTIPIVLTGELFPAKVKAMGMTLADFVYLVASLSSIQLYQNLARLYGIDVPFYIFGSCTIATFLFSLIFVPETKGRSLEEIQFILKGETCPPKLTQS